MRKVDTIMLIFCCFLALWLAFPVALGCACSLATIALTALTSHAVRSHLATLTHAARTEEQVREASSRAAAFFREAVIAQERADAVNAAELRACGNAALASALAMRAGVSVSFAAAVVTAHAPSAMASVIVTPEATSSHSAAFTGDDGVSYVTTTSLTIDDASPTVRFSYPAFQPTAARTTDARIVALCDAFDYASAVSSAAGVYLAAKPEATVSVKRKSTRKPAARKSSKRAASAMVSQ